MDTFKVMMLFIHLAMLEKNLGHDLTSIFTVEFSGNTCRNSFLTSIARLKFNSCVSFTFRFPEKANQKCPEKLDKKSKRDMKNKLWPKSMNYKKAEMIIVLLCTDYYDIVSFPPKLQRFLGAGHVQMLISRRLWCAWPTPRIF